jgi:hypothetical protein
VNPELCKWYKGDLRKWFSDLMRIAKPEALPSCWQARDGQKFCDGHALQYEVILSIPLILVIEMGDIAANNTWDIPQALYPYPNDTVASAHRLKYTIASHVYLSPGTSHFMTRYTSGTRVFDYDGMKRDGNAILREGSLKGLLTGTSNALKEIPAGFFPNALVYHLDGGEAAQTYFRTRQIQLAEKKLHLHFETNGTGIIPSSCELRRPHLETLTGQDRWWLDEPSSAIDYRLVPPQKSPQKWHPPMAPQNADSNSSSASASEEDELEQSQNSPPSSRDTSLPAIATLHLPSVTNSGAGAVLSGRKLRCHPCGENGFVTEDSDPIACQKCGNWSHIRCVQPLAYENSDSEAKSQLSWHSPQFLFVCTVCKVRHNFTPECDAE